MFWQVHVERTGPVPTGLTDHPALNSGQEIWFPGTSSVLGKSFCYSGPQFPYKSVELRAIKSSSGLNCQDSRKKISHGAGKEIDGDLSVACCCCLYQLRMGRGWTTLQTSVLRFLLSPWPHWSASFLGWKLSDSSLLRRVIADASAIFFDISCWK